MTLTLTFIFGCVILALVSLIIIGIAVALSYIAINSIARYMKTKNNDDLILAIFFILLSILTNCYIGYLSTGGK